ncbi:MULTISPECIES: alpha/beta hydrolase [unclassified Leifsonia]|uniref:alpha/beta hydrolase n=1 Tax=unclassified Leifsonia TaxID=2663824 RepID=UPI000B077A28|nr:MULTISPECIES: alpha/beta hydrolase [unclassified Leifsonia]
MTPYERVGVPVDGGELAVGSWSPEAGGMPLVGIHGITSSHRAWRLVAENLPDTRVIAPDLRGRGRSSGLPAPYGLVQHADDLARMLDALGVDHVALAGHSMGGFVAVRFAARHPDRVRRLVLIDGGLPIPAPEGVAPEDVPAVLLGPALERLGMRFATFEEYRAFWQRHPALGPWWTGSLDDYIGYDLVGEAPELRSSADPEAVSVNALELDGSGGYAEALAGLQLPVSFIRAPRGLLDAQPLYDPAVVAEWQQRLPGMRVREATDVNHYTILLTEAGVRQVLPLLHPPVPHPPVPHPPGGRAPVPHPPVPHPPGGRAPVPHPPVPKEAHA